MLERRKAPSPPLLPTAAEIFPKLILIISVKKAFFHTQNCGDHQFEGGIEKRIAEIRSKLCVCAEGELRSVVWRQWWGSCRHWFLRRKTACRWADIGSFPARKLSYFARVGCLHGMFRTRQVLPRFFAPKFSAPESGKRGQDGHPLLA